jgi:pyruvate,water dikinase
MKSDPAFADIHFEAPGPGSWELERAHFARPITRFGAEAVTRGMPRGFSESTARYGLLLSHIKIAVVHGFPYAQPVIYGAPEGGSRPPPAFVLWLFLRLSPKMRARIKRSRVAFETKLWREDLDRWDRIDRPRATEINRSLQAIDPASLDGDALIEHLRRAQANMVEMVALHHRYNFAFAVPMGDYVAHTLEWTGAAPAEALELLRGTSPMSKGVAADELEALGQALRSSEAGRDVLARRGDPQGTLDALAAMEGDLGAKTRAYLDLVRFRSMGFDVTDKTGGELPEMLVRAIQTVVRGGAKARDEREQRDEKEKALRERVPREHRAKWDEMLAEARLMNHLRDERALYSDSWGTGLARRAVIEAGRRLVAAGKAEDPEWRSTATPDIAPPWLNRPHGEPPPRTIFPKDARRMSNAVDAILHLMARESEAPSTEAVIRGLPIHAGVVEGTARVVLNPADFGKIQEGDVLVTRATSTAFNVVLPLLGGIVTDRGGQLSHAAIVAREYGIPGVVGTKDATTAIPDGARVRVDGAAGEVTILSQQGAREPSDRRDRQEDRRATSRD